MATNRINDENLLLSKYFANNSTKTADIEKTGKSTSTASNKSNNTSSLSDVLELSSNNDPLVYNNYNATGQYETMPSLVDFLNGGSSSSSNSNSDDISNNNALKLLGATGGSQLSLVDFLNNGDADKQSGTDAYASVFASLSEQSAAKTELLMQQAIEKMNAKDSSDSKV